MAESQTFGTEARPMRTGRIEALTDGIYAIAMTILVLNIEAPGVARTNQALLQALGAMQNKFFDFFLSFFLLAIFWKVHHHHFHVILRVDDRLLWINAFSLAFVVLIPFSTSIFSEHRNLAAAAIFFEANILIIGLLKYLHWAYATGRRRLVAPDLSERNILIGKLMNLVTPAVSLAAIGLAWFTPDWSTSMYILTPFIIGYLRKYQ